jgi:serine phosphatase RsbU (regulator of sigma subunit)
MRLDISTGRLDYVNAGHPEPLLIRNNEVIEQLTRPTTLPVGFGGDEPEISKQTLQRGDRVLCFTDGLIEEHQRGSSEFGEEQLIHWVNHIQREDEGVRGAVRSLSHTLKQKRGGRTSDDATLFMIEWRGGSDDHLARID